MAYVTPDQLQALRDLQAIRDRNAQELGVITMKWYETLRHAHHEILQSDAAQRRLGEGLLRALGFDPSTENLTIDMATGAIQRLVRGRWAETE